MKIPDKEYFKAFIMKNHFLIIIILLSIAFYSINFSSEVIVGDDAHYMQIGKSITEGNYPGSFFHRMPLLPGLFADLYSLGIGVIPIRFLLPLFFIILSLVSTFLLARELSGERIAEISTILLFVFPQFWRWGMKFLADIPLLALSTLSLFLFIKSLKDKRYFIPTGVVLGLGLLTKIYFIILPLSMLLYLLIRRRDVFKSRELWYGVIVSVLIFTPTFYAITSMESADHFSQVGNVFEAGQNLTPIKQIITGEYTTVLYLQKLVLFPVLVFIPFGIYYFWKKRNRLPLLYLIIFLAFFFTLGTVRLRYFAPLYTIIAILVAEGFFYLFNRFKNKTRMLITVIFSTLVLVSFINTVYLVSLESESNFGIDTLSNNIKDLSGTFASDYMPRYLNLTNNVITDNNFNEEIFYSNFSEDSLLEMEVNYVILSIYGEFARSPSNQTYHPYYSGIELTFIDRPYTGDRVPPDFGFHSELFQEIETSPAFEKAEEIYSPKGQRIFIIYRIV